jgi:RNA polymerase sigma-70 factor (ECF subfamily)
VQLSATSIPSPALNIDDNRHRLDDSSEALRLAILAHDSHGIADGIQAMHPRLLGFALAVLPSRQAAEDVVQETWIAVIRGASAFEGRAQFSTWVMGVLRNKARGAMKKEQQIRGREVLADEDFRDPLDGRLHTSGPDAGHWSHPPTFRFLPEHQAELTELWEQIAAGLRSLPLTQRQVVLLRDVDGMTPQEVSELLGLSTGHQRTLLHRARAKLRGQLETYLARPAETPNGVHLDRDRA